MLRHSFSAATKKSQLCAVSWVALAALTMTGCGQLGQQETSPKTSSAAVTEDPGNAKKADVKTIFREVDDQIKSAKSLSLRVSVTGDPELSYYTMSGEINSEDGAFEFAKTAGGIENTLIVDGVVYTQGNQKFWKTTLEEEYTAELGAKLEGKYIILPEEAVADLQSRNLRALLDDLEFDETNFIDHFLNDVTDTNFEGKPALKIVDKRAKSAHIIVSAEAPHSLLEITELVEEEGKELLITATFSDWNTVPPIVKPSADQIVTL